MVNRRINRLIESNLSVEEIVSRLTESAQEEEVQKPVRESRFRKKEVVAERHSMPDDMDEDNEEEEGW